MSKRANPMAVKATLTYEIKDAAKALGVSVATIRNWIKDGLPVMASQKPFLILGAELRAYLRAKHRAKKSPLKHNQLYCLSCKTGCEPHNLTVTPTPNSPRTLRITGTCGRCGGTSSRIISLSKVSEFARSFHFKKNGNI